MAADRPAAEQPAAGDPSADIRAAVDAWALLAACPEAFAVVDPDLRVVVWNAAAEELTGFTAADAIGRRPPHLTDTQLDLLEESMGRFDEWADDVPAVLPRRHASGRSVQMTVTAYHRLRDVDGRTVAFASFFRATRPTDRLAHVRNTYARALAGAVRAEDALAALHASARELLHADRGYLLRRSAEGRWEGWLAVGDAADVAEDITPADPEVLDRAVRAGRCRTTHLRVRGADLHVLVVPAGPAEAGTALALVVDAADPHVDQGLAIALASDAWAALQRVRAVDELETQVEVLEAIAGVSAGQAVDADTVIAHVTRHAATSLSCERAAVYLGEDDGTLQLGGYVDLETDAPTAQGTDDPDVHAEGHAAVERILRAVAADHRPLLLQDARAATWLAGPWDPARGVHSLFALPLVVADRLLGVLVVAHAGTPARGFTALCTQVGGALAGQAALAISNALLFDAQRAAAEESRRVERERADWVAGIAHDLRSPVTAIIGFAKTLRRAAEVMTEAERDEALEVVQRQSLRVARMLDDMMDSARAEAGELRPDLGGDVCLRRCVDDAVAVVSPEDRERLRLDLDADVHVCGDAGQLTRVVQNLVVNALHHAPHPTPVDVVVGAEGPHGVVTVRDRGPGLPDDVQLFSPFARGPHGGTGMGLYAVGRIVALHEGRVEPGPTPGGGTTMRILLPREGAPGGC